MPGSETSGFTRRANIGGFLKHSAIMGFFDLVKHFAAHPTPMNRNVCAASGGANNLIERTLGDKGKG
jgi:hypothetical protein